MLARAECIFRVVLGIERVKCCCCMETWPHVCILVLFDWSRFKRDRFKSINFIPVARMAQCLVSNLMNSGEKTGKKSRSIYHFLKKLFMSTCDLGSLRINLSNICSLHSFISFMHSFL